jgi:sec-independent protein translocase protein TatB
MFFGLGWAEVLVIGLVAFFVFGPERLPGMARDAARLIRQLREMAQGVGDDLKQHMPEKDGYGLEEFREVRDEFRDLRDLNPKRMVTKAFFDDGTEGQAVAATGALATATNASRAPIPGASPSYDVDAT